MTLYTAVNYSRDLSCTSQSQKMIIWKIASACNWTNIIIFYTYIVLLHDDYSTYTKPEGRGTVIQLVVRKIDGTTSKHLAAGTKINAQYTILSIKTSILLLICSILLQYFLSFHTHHQMKVCLGFVSAHKQDCSSYPMMDECLGHRQGFYPHQGLTPYLSLNQF